MTKQSFSANLEVESTAVLMALSGPQSSVLTEIARQSGTEISLRGNTIYLTGEEVDVRVAHRYLRDAAVLVSKGFELNQNDVAGSVRALRADPNRSLGD